METEQIEDFKYPSRMPIILLILLVVAGVIAVRWYKSGHQFPVDGKSGQWSCPLFCKKDKPAEAVIPPQVAVPVEPAVNEQPVQTNSATNLPAVPSVQVVADTNEALAKPLEQEVREAAAPPNSTATDDFSKGSDGDPAVRINADVQAAIALEEGKEILKARKKYLELLKTTLDAKLREEVELRVGRINMDLVMTPAAMPGKQEYVVQSGDSLDKLAKKFGTTIELIQKGNLLSTHVIKIGDRLMILAGKFAIKVSKARNDMVVTLDDEFFARYGVGTGKFGKTPAGSFVINDKITDPVWWRPDGKEVPFGDPENILGTRWMSIKASGTGTPDVKGYGIHGTWDESSIGKSESAGCIRMKNSEVEQLFSMVPAGTVVTITE